MIDEIKQTIEILNKGGTILYPTDTLWGIGCDATNAEAVDKVIALKKREKKSFIVLIENINQLSRYVEDIPEVAYQLIELSEKPVTIIFDKAKNVADNVLNDDGSLAIRVVKHKFCEGLIRRFRKPIVATSANVSDEPTPISFDEISDDIKSGVDYIVDFDRNEPSLPPSTLIKLGSGGLIKIIRK